MTFSSNKGLPTELSKAGSGRLTACILSAYDLPDGIQPSHVSMTLLGEEVRTGPPSARHRDSNAFKFVSDNSQSGEVVCKKHEISVSAPLNLLYRQSAVFRVK
eukprot:876041_1